MDAPLYERVTTEEGDVQYREVSPPEPEPRELTDEEFKADPRYREVLNESIDRRKRLAATRDSAAGLGIIVGQDGTLSMSETEKEEEATPTPPPPPAPLDEDALYERFIQRQREDAEKEAEAKSKLNQEVAQLAEQHGLTGDEDALQILLGSRNPSETAAVLGRRRVQLDEIRANGAETIKPASDIAAGVAARLGITMKA